jgi:hypothetical protein
MTVDIIVCPLSIPSTGIATELTVPLSLQC